MTEGLGREERQVSGSRSIHNVISIVHKYLFVKHFIEFWKPSIRFIGCAGCGQGYFEKRVGSKPKVWRLIDLR